MFFEIIISIFFGLICGIFTGLIPGIHVNLISLFLINLVSKIYINPIYGIIFITSLAITHTFLDFIPSIFLGCPDTDTELSILPGHKLLKEGKGYEAVYLSNLGSLFAIIIILVLLPFFTYFLPKIYPFIQKIIPYFLILVIIFLIFHEKNKIISLKVILLTGLLGFCINQIDFNQPLLPLLSGLFGIPNIILSIQKNTKIPKQKITKPKTNIKRPIIASIFSAPICSFLPGIGSSQASLIGNILIKQSKKQFLILNGIINTLVMGFSIITLYSINKTRSGASVSIQQIFPNLEFKHLILIVIIIIISGIISFFITEKISRIITLKFEKINYKKISIITILIIILITFLICNFYGIIVLIISTLTGLYCIKQKTHKSNMMGAIIIPTIFWLI